MILSNLLKRSTRALFVVLTGSSLLLSTTAAMADDSFSQKLLGRAMDLVGVKYRFGGTSPTTGLDCSGYVQYVFKNAVGISLPRVASAQSQVGERVANGDLRMGDMVFFNTRGFAASHVGIYAGNGMFIHSPRSGSSVRLDSMDNSYWKARYNGARRVSGSGSNANSVSGNAPRGM
ncbi:MAG: C40 family peptidase [Formosimonas sp.]